MSRRLLVAGLVLAAAAAWTAPRWLPIRDPNAQPDTLTLRNLPPLAAVEGLRADDGSLRFGEEVRTLDGGGMEIRRGGTWTSFPAGSVRVVERFWLGTDEFGRDLLSRLLHGARVSLAVGLLAAALALTLGAAVGLAAGLGGPLADAALMRATDVALAVPKLFLLMLLVSVCGPSSSLAAVAIGATTWMATARVVRSEVLSLRNRGFVEAARAGGTGPLRLAFRHLTPALVPTLAAEGALRVGQAILLESSLSFLGLVVPPPAPTWGSMVAEGRTRLHDAWWIATFPGAAIATTVLAVHVLGESVRRRAGVDGRARSVTRAGRGGTVFELGTRP